MIRRTTRQNSNIRLLVAVVIPSLFLLIGVGFSVLLPKALWYPFYCMGWIGLLPICLYFFVYFAFSYFYFHQTPLQEIKEFLLRNRLDRAFLAMGAYHENVWGHIVTPKVAIKQDYLYIDFLGFPTIQDKLSKFQDQLSSALPKGWMVESISMDPSQDLLKVQISDFTKKQQSIIHSFSDLCVQTRNLNPTAVYIDGSHIVDFKETPGLLITGSTGSGKTYGSRYLITQGIAHRWHVIILDIKRTYQAYEDYCDCFYAADDIMEKLKEICDEIDARSCMLGDYLRENPNVCASDIGLPVIYVVIEEYIALMQSVTPKEQKEIERLVTRIAVTGRQLSVIPCIIMQVSMADQLSSSIRSNLNAKLVYGTASETIYKTAFGLTDVPKIAYDFAKGQGLGMIENHRFFFQTPKLDFKVAEIGEIIKKA